MGLSIKNHRIFLLILLLFLIIKISSLFVAHDIWWDSAVYVGMGKHIYSSGEAGLWEASRPLVLPLILGFFWKIGLDYIFFGRLLVTVFSLGVLILTYLIGYELFSKKTAIVAALFLALSPAFFVFGNILHSEIPSAFFVLMGFYFFIKKKYNFSGLFLGISFITRFFQIFAFVPLAILLFYLAISKKRPYKTLFYFSLFFLIPVIPYLILNYFLYGNIFYPFLLQSWMSKYTGWIFSQPFGFYFIGLIKENILVLFSILALVFIFKNPSLNKTALVLVFLSVFAPYNLVAHKEMRLIIASLPFLYILASYGLFYFIDVIKIRKSGFLGCQKCPGFLRIFKKQKTLILFLLLIIFIVFNVPKLKFDRYEDNLDMFYDYVETTKIDNGLWISNPSFIAFSDKKADELIYYPLYNSEKIDNLVANIGNAEHVLINTCDLLPCPPDDILCNSKHDNFIDLLKERFTLKSYNKRGSCEHYIFRKY